MDIQRFHVGTRLSQIVTHGNTVYLSGQVPDGGGTDASVQTRQVLDKVDRLLAQVGSDKTRILSATIYLADIQQFVAVNKEWEAWMPAGFAPARATVEARLANPAYLVEIQVIATLPNNGKQA